MWALCLTPLFCVVFIENNIYRRSFYSIEIYDGRILVLKRYNSKIKCNGAYKIKKGIRNAKHIRGGSSKMKKRRGGPIDERTFSVHECKSFILIPNLYSLDNG